MSDDRLQLLRTLEALLFAVAEPMAEAAILRHLPEGADVRGLLDELAALYAGRGVNLVPRDGKWAFRTAGDLAGRLQIEVPVTRKLSRAAVETLAVIAYHQPITRGEIEEIRGVTLSRGTLDTLLELGWIRPRARRQTPGRPVTWAVSDAFYDHFGLEGPDGLPGIEELRATGLLERTSPTAALGGRAMRDLAGPEAAEPAEALDEEALVDGLELDEPEPAAVNPAQRSA